MSGAQAWLLLYFPHFEAKLALLVDVSWVSCGFVTTPHLRGPCAPSSEPQELISTLCGLCLWESVGPKDGLPLSLDSSAEGA